MAGPAGANFTSALGAKVVNAEDISTTGKYYAEVLDDIDTLVGTDTAFMLGPWIEMARAFAANNTDCTFVCLSVVHEYYCMPLRACCVF